MHYPTYITPAPTTIYTLSLHDALPISETIVFNMGAVSGDYYLKVVAGDSGQNTTSGLQATLNGHKLTDRKSTRLNSSHVEISYAVFCLKKKKATNRHNHATTAL